MARMKDLAHDLGITDYTDAPTDTEIVEWLGEPGNHFRISTMPSGWLLHGVGSFSSLRLAVIAAMRAEKGAGK